MPLGHLEQRCDMIWLRVESISLAAVLRQDWREQVQKSQPRWPAATTARTKDAGWLGWRAALGVVRCGGFWLVWKQGRRDLLRFTDLQHDFITRERNEQRLYAWTVDTCNHTLKRSQILGSLLYLTFIITRDVFLPVKFSLNFSSSEDSALNCSSFWCNLFTVSIWD